MAKKRVHQKLIRNFPAQGIFPLLFLTVTAGPSTIPFHDLLFVLQSLKAKKKENFQEKAPAGQKIHGVPGFTIHQPPIRLPVGTWAPYHCVLL